MRNNLERSGLNVLLDAAEHAEMMIEAGKVFAVLVLGLFHEQLEIWYMHRIKGRFDGKDATFPGICHPKHRRIVRRPLQRKRNLPQRELDGHWKLHNQMIVHRRMHFEHSGPFLVVEILVRGAKDHGPAKNVVGLGPLLQGVPIRRHAQFGNRSFFLKGHGFRSVVFVGYQLDRDAVQEWPIQDDRRPQDAHRFGSIEERNGHLRDGRRGGREQIKVERIGHVEQIATGRPLCRQGRRWSAVQGNPDGFRFELQLQELVVIVVLFGGCVFVRTDSQQILIGLPRRLPSSPQPRWLLGWQEHRRSLAGMDRERVGVRDGGFENDRVGMRHVQVDARFGSGRGPVDGSGWKLVDDHPGCRRRVLGMVG